MIAEMAGRIYVDPKALAQADCLGQRGELFVLDEGLRANASAQAFSHMLPS
jgi:hypothetical protein